VERDEAVAQRLPVLDVQPLLDLALQRHDLKTVDYTCPQLGHADTG
jgi:hypothetical protein